MNQEKISAFIKKIRTENNLTQLAFAKKYGVSYQAVSKWENGKNIPDISILKQICDDYHIDLNDLLEGKKNNNKLPKRIFFAGLVIIIIMLLISYCLFFMPKKNKDDFEFKKLSTSCDNFDIYGSMAYSDSKTSIYISNISYCGEEDKEVYKKLNCTLYEVDNDTKKIIGTYSSNEELTLDKFLEKANLNVEHYSNNCQMYKEGALELEIEAITYNDETKLYKIPVTLDDC